MIPAPLALKKLSEEVGLVQSAHLSNTVPGEAQERVDAVEVILSASGLVFALMTATAPINVKH